VIFCPNTVTTLQPLLNPDCCVAPIACRSLLTPFQFHTRRQSNSERRIWRDIGREYAREDARDCYQRALTAQASAASNPSSCVSQTETRSRYFYFHKAALTAIPATANFSSPLSVSLRSCTFHAILELRDPWPLLHIPERKTTPVTSHLRASFCIFHFSVMVLS